MDEGSKGRVWYFCGVAAQLFFLFYGTGRLGEILDTVRQLEQYIKIRPVYLITLLKMTGITYSAEFASGICKDAGYSSLGKQIEIFGKLTNPGSEYADPSGIIWHTGPDTYIGDLKNEKTGKQVAGGSNFCFFLFFQAHMTAFGEEPAKDPLAQLEEEMGIGEEIQRGSRNIWMGCGQREERSPLQI